MHNLSTIKQMNKEALTPKALHIYTLGSLNRCLSGWYYTYHFMGVRYQGPHFYSTKEMAKKAQEGFIEWKNNQLISDAEEHLINITKVVKAL